MIIIDSVANNFQNAANKIFQMLMLQNGLSFLNRLYQQTTRCYHRKRKGHPSLLLAIYKKQLV